MTNKKIGNNFESEFCEMLSAEGFWVHNLQQNSAGQPADVIAVKNSIAYLIDCKVCSTDKGLDLRRMEENQDLAMTLWEDCGNGLGWFAIKLSSAVYMIPHFTIKEYQNSQSYLSPSEVFELGRPFEKWVMRCR